ncbi:hypothetical protein BDV35DRAFT_360509 [Aspergillus flavus]|uniref:Uncharacterized protein n=1 Tax=Aspergillus flavus TaxID=5059 RepID=A0A5N6GRK4_ASPFL|nr:hypothetical protein BDV35DRAFT_360509 [Aspergillus flavus]
MTRRKSLAARLRGGHCFRSDLGSLSEWRKTSPTGSVQSRGLLSARSYLRRSYCVLYGVCACTLRSSMIPQIDPDRVSLSPDQTTPPFPEHFSWHLTPRRFGVGIRIIPLVR